LAVPPDEAPQHAETAAPCDPESLGGGAIPQGQERVDVDPPGPSGPEYRNGEPVAAPGGELLRKHDLPTARRLAVQVDYGHAASVDRHGCLAVTRRSETNAMLRAVKA
jgi:hypothetical protein